MPSDLAGLRRDRAKASDRMTEITAAARGRSMTDTEKRDFEAAEDSVRDLDTKIAAAEAEVGRLAASSIPRVEAAEVAKLCVEGGVPGMAASLLAEGITVEEAKKRIAAAGEAKNLVALARRKDPSIPEDLAATLLAEGKSVEQIRTALFDKLVAGEERTPIASHIPVADPRNVGVAATTTSMERELKRSGLTKKEG